MARSRAVTRFPLVLVSVLALVAGACGGAVPTTSPAGASIAATAAASAPASPAAASGGTLTFAVEGDIASLDPSQAYDQTSYPAVHMLFDQLLAYDAGTKLGPGLATEMPSLSADGLTYTFKLRSGVKFVKGDGTALRDMTADDVVYSLNRILDPKLTPHPSPVGGAFFTLIAGGQDVVDGKAKTAAGLKAIDPLTVEIKLREPNRAFLNILAMSFGSVVPKELAGQDTTAFSAAPVGTGPFYLASYKKGELAVFKKNPLYWNPALPKVDAVEMRLQVKVNTQIQQVQAGQLDIASNQIPSGSFTSIVNDPALKDQVVRAPQVAVNYLAIDVSGPNKALADVRVRQAIAHAIDKDNQIKVANGRGVVANCIFPPQMSAFNPNCNPYPFDVAKAKALMKDAGYEQGFKTQLFTDTTDLSKAYSEAIVQDLAEIGITADLVQQDFNVLLGTISTPHQAPLVYVGWFQDFPDPSDFIDPILSCATAVKGGSNASWYCNTTVDALAAAARAESDDAKRIAMYQDVEQKIMADVPWVPTTFNEYVLLKSKRTRGPLLHPTWFFDLNTASVGG
jgi:peptide/nickel transport system substrate-binding protein